VSYKVELASTFKKEAKRLSKKYPSLIGELEVLFSDLEINPTQGTHLGNNVYKIRLAVASKGRGKSGGVRIISFIRIVESTVILLTIYSKGDKDSISDQAIKELLKAYL
jgi:mRNA-degrading endonuclease RelE of RelBE toxin-antitoxin system